MKLKLKNKDNKDIADLDFPDDEGMIWLFENKEDMELIRDAIKNKKENENIFISGSGIKIIFNKAKFGSIEVI